ncbi:phage terminase small subunit, partial [Alicyclobacillus suci]|uniref:phage terminase small subunit n=1 Tax=Alicyclobacillus suci TaxID=2816080 RepID=UPI001A8BF600
MPRERSPNRDKAFEVWRDSNGEISNREIAIQLGISEKTVGGWKAKDRWIEKLNGVLQTNERSTPKRAGAPKHNQNAVGNRGGAPLQNDNAVTHGFFRKYFPEAVHELLADVAAMSELDKLWMSIQTQFTAIIHAQKVMFVSDSEDHSDFQTKKISGESMDVEEYERQWSFQKQANFLSAQARAMSELRSSIKTFLELADESDLR